MKTLVFDISASYAHYKKAYATTSAVSYLIPPKTSLYGYIGAILGLQKRDNIYLEAFAEKQCLIGLSLLRPVELCRMGVNLKAELGRRKEGGTPKPTLMEFVRKPCYRIYFTHQDKAVFKAFRHALEQHYAVYTPSLGLANCLSSFEYVGEFDAEYVESDKAVWIDSVIPKQQFIRFEYSQFNDNQLFITEQSMFPIEMDVQRNVVERDDILLERKGQPVMAFVKPFYKINQKNVILF
jgi:CRISPR-associated protein Cas5h